MTDRVVLFKKKGAVAYITLNRPEKINCLNDDMYQQLADAVEDYVSDKNLRCAIISGAGGNFSSGGDIKWLREKRLAAKAEGRNLHYDFPGFRALERCEKPVIAAIDGYCIASGFNLAVLFCDIRIATTEAKLATPGAKRGLTDAGNLDVYAAPYTWYAGLGDMLYMLLTAEYITAENALRMSLVNEVVPRERLMERATELAELIASNSPQTVRAYKLLMRRFQEVPGSFYLRLRNMIFGNLDQADYFEGTAAFLEKREPNWPS